MQYSICTVSICEKLKVVKNCKCWYHWFTGKLRFTHAEHLINERKNISKPGGTNKQRRLEKQNKGREAKQRQTQKGRVFTCARRSTRVLHLRTLKPKARSTQQHGAPTCTPLSPASMSFLTPSFFPHLELLQILSPSTIS